MQAPLANRGAGRRRWNRYTSTFVTIPPGPGMTDRLKAAAGALLGIAVTGLLRGIVAGAGLAHPLLVAPMGASAVLLFAVPASPLAQPWSVLGGNILSALVGISVSIVVPNPTLAAAMAVGAAVVIMSMARCLHPPGGAVALSSVLSGVGHSANPYLFALLPVGLNSLLLTMAAVIFHRFSCHSYPHRPPPDKPGRSFVTRESIEMALNEYGEALDVDPEDLLVLFHSAERLSRQSSPRP